MDLTVQYVWKIQTVFEAERKAGSRRGRERLVSGQMKKERRAKIIELIEKYQIETQEELAEKLEEAGFTVTQATISRDIRELKLTKVSVDGVHQRYTYLNKK